MLLNPFGQAKGGFSGVTLPDLRSGTQIWILEASMLPNQDFCREKKMPSLGGLVSAYRAARHPREMQALLSVIPPTQPSSFPVVFVIEGPAAHPSSAWPTKDANFVCANCGCRQTPERRRGPLGPRTLCNRHAFRMILTLILEQMWAEVRSREGPV